MSFEPPSSSEMMWSISSVLPVQLRCHAVLSLNRGLGRLRHVAVVASPQGRRADELLGQLRCVGAGEHCRSGIGLRVQSVVCVRARPGLVAPDRFFGFAELASPPAAGRQKIAARATG